MAAHAFTDVCATDSGKLKEKDEFKEPVKSGSTSQRQSTVSARQSCVITPSASFARQFQRPASQRVSLMLKHPWEEDPIGSAGDCRRTKSAHASRCNSVRESVVRSPSPSGSEDDDLKVSQVLSLKGQERKRRHDSRHDSHRRRIGVQSATQFGELFRQILSAHVDSLTLLSKERDDLCQHVRLLHKRMLEANLSIEENYEVFAHAQHNFDFNAYADLMNSCSSASSRSNLPDKQFLERTVSREIIEHQSTRGFAGPGVSVESRANLQQELHRELQKAQRKQAKNRRRREEEKQERKSKPEGEQGQDSIEEDFDQFDSMALMSEEEQVSYSAFHSERSATYHSEGRRETSPAPAEVNQAKQSPPPDRAAEAAAAIIDEKPEAADSALTATSCKACGNLLMSDSVFCRKCGQKRSAPQEKEEMATPASHVLSLPLTPRSDAPAMEEGTAGPGSTDSDEGCGAIESNCLSPKSNCVSPKVNLEVPTGSPKKRVTLGGIPGVPGEKSGMPSGAPAPVEAGPLTNGPGKRLSLVGQMEDKQRKTSFALALDQGDSEIVNMKLGTSKAKGGKLVVEEQDEREQPDECHSLSLGADGESHPRWGSCGSMQHVNFAGAATSRSGSLQEASEFVPLPEWCDAPVVKDSSGHIRTTGARRSSRKSQLSWDPEEDPVAKAPPSMCSHIICEPSSKRRLLWDFGGMIFLVYDFVFIPLGVFGTMDNSIMNSISVSNTSFWTLDMISCFWLAYTNQGKVIMNFKAIAFHYLRTWFFLDLVLCGLDWSIFIMDNIDKGDSSSMSMGKLVRSSRAVRALRLARLLKLRRIVEEIQDMINSEHIQIMVNLFKLILLLLAINHIIACLWYGLGDLSNDGGHLNWISTYNFYDRELQYRYLTALHWSLTQFTPASMHVQPQNSYERAFAIAVLILALIFFSSFVSSITSSMTRLWNINEDTVREFWLLRRYLKENGVPPALSAAVQRFCDYAWRARTEHIREDKVKFLSLLSSQLHAELQAFITMPYLQVHPFFEYINNASDVVAQRLFARAMTRVFLAADDSVFFQAEKAISMFFVIEGDFLYMKARPAGTSVSNAVTHEDWICEMALWMPWEHPGSLCAVTDGEIMSVAASEFGTVLRTSPVMHSQANSYASWFVGRMNNLDTWHLTDIGRSRYERTRIKRFLKDTLGVNVNLEARSDSRSLTMDFTFSLAPKVRRQMSNFSSGGGNALAAVKTLFRSRLSTKMPENKKVSVKITPSQDDEQ